MEKLLAVVLALLCVFSSVAVGESDTRAFLDHSRSTLSYQRDIVELLTALGEIENPTEVHLELAFRYLEMWFECSDIYLLESAVFFGQEMPTSLVGNEALNNVIQLCRAGSEAGVLSISSIIDRCVGLVDPSKR